MVTIGRMSGNDGKRLIIWGAGALGSLVAVQWTAGDVLGVTETTRRHERLRALGVSPHTGSALPLLAAEDTLLIALPGDETKAEAVAALTATAPPQRVLLISSTAYYEGRQGTLREETPPGATQRAQRVAALERDFQAWAGARGVIVRLGGLYQAGRGPLAALARRGTATKKAANRSLPLIHYEDAATAVATALQLAAVKPVYLAVTPPCPTRRAFYTAACARLNLPLPPFAPPQPGDPPTYDVSRLRRDLLPQPRYPDWRAALDLAGEGGA